MTTDTGPSTGPSTDPRPAFAAATRTAAAAIAAVRPDQLTAPTPCTEYDVRALAGHLVAVLRRVAAVGRGEPPLSVPQVVTDVADAGWGAAAHDALQEALAPWQDAELLGRTLTLPFGTHPGAAALAVYTGELTTHTWDLAAATGQSPQWDPRVFAVALPAIRRALPAERRGAEVPFGPAVPVPDDAPPIHQLVAWQGRDPGWSPATIS